MAYKEDSWIAQYSIITFIGWFIMKMPAINHITDIIIICCVLLQQKSLQRIACFKSIICLHVITECEAIYLFTHYIIIKMQTELKEVYVRLHYVTLLI